MKLRLYHSVLKEKKFFTPNDSSRVTMYVCGPTVYSTPHIGNARPAVVFDLLYRVLKNLYPKVVYARNITDVDDKINNASAKEGVSIDVISKRYTKAYHEDVSALSCLYPDVEPKATEHIGEMIEGITQLVSKGHGYEAEGHVLFSVQTYSEYGKISNRKVEDNLAGARVDIASYKKHPQDFVLWKPAKDDEPGWDSPWGRGRPGWHIECTMMIFKHLGFPVDIHAGGGDLLFPHHENENAQGVCLGHAKEYCNYWLHNGMIHVEQEKMSKSLGNIVLLRDLLKKHEGESVRLALLQTHYRQPLIWKNGILDQAKTLLDKVYRALESVKDVQVSGYSWQDIPEEIQHSLCDDLNTPVAIGHWLSLLKRMSVAEGVEQKKSLKKSVLACNNVLGLGLQDPCSWFQKEKGQQIEADEIEKMIKERDDARMCKDYAKSDKIRSKLDSLGVVLEDKKGLSTWRYK